MTLDKDLVIKIVESTNRFEFLWAQSSNYNMGTLLYFRDLEDDSEDDSEDGRQLSFRYDPKTFSLKLLMEIITKRYADDSYRKGHEDARHGVLEALGIEIK